MSILASLDTFFPSTPWKYIMYFRDTGNFKVKALSGLKPPG